MLASGDSAPTLADRGVCPPALLAFFKTDCPACHLALRYLDGLYRQVSGRAPVVAVSQDAAEPTTDLMRSLGLEIPICFDEGLRTSSLYGLQAVPALFLLDQQGTIAASSQGFDKGDLNRLASALGALLDIRIADPAPAGDGNPDFQPGCLSRHLEPQAPGEVLSPLELYSRRGVRASRVALPADSEPEEFCYERGFADPLPVVPPTVARVERMLGAVDLPPEEIVAYVPPNYAPASVEKIAANAVMAGCRSAYMRVLVPMVRALCDERLNLHGVQGTTHFAAPLAIVNGPVRHELGFAYGSNVFSNAARANSTLGRALQLILRNLGGAAPGRIDMSTMGNPGRFSFVIAENEGASPWDPLSVDFGFAPGRDTVTFYCAEPPRAVSEHKARRAEGLRQGKPWERGCDELKLFTASQRVRHPSGRGPAGQPGASVAWRAATHVVKRTQRVVKRRYGASKSQSSTPSSSSQRGQHRERRYRRGAGGSAGVGERAHSHGMARRGTWETLHGPRAKAGTRTTGRNKGSGPAPLPAGERERTSRRGVVPAGESISRREAVQGVVAPA